MTDRAAVGEGDARPLGIDDIRSCFEGAVPGVLCTASSDGIPNVTYVSRAHQVDEERVAVSNQFLSKTARNIAGNPRASLLLIDPITHDEFRLQLVYERTERRGHVFERLRADVDALAALEGMQDVFRLRAADIYRVVDLEQVPPSPSGRAPEFVPAGHRGSPELAALAELVGRLARCGTLDDLLDAALEGLDQLLGYQHSYLLLADADGRRLSTFASRGFDREAIGAEIEVGVGLAGAAAERCQAMRAGNLHQVTKYTRSVRRQFEDSGNLGPGPTIGLPGLPDAESLLAVPVQALGQLVGVVVVESPDQVAFGPADEQLVGVVAAVVAQAVERLRETDEEDPTAPAATTPDPAPSPPTTPPRPAVAADGAATIRFYAVDGSTFLDGEYLIKGVAGRILWSLLGHHQREGRTEFTNKELRLDPTLDLPGFKDNLESRLLLLKRRLDEHGAPIRMTRTGRGRFRLDVAVPVRLEADPLTGADQ